MTKQNKFELKWVWLTFKGINIANLRQLRGKVLGVIPVLMFTSIHLGAESIASDEHLGGSLEEKLVLSVITSMTEAFNQKNMAGIMASYESGAGVVFEPGRQVSGSSQLMSMFNQAFQINPAFSYPNGHEVFIANDIALHISPWVMKATSPDGSMIKDKGLSVAVLRKQDDGRWLMVLDDPHGSNLLGPVHTD